MSEQQPVTCSSCGTVAPDGAPIDWTTQRSEHGRGVERVCSSCIRENLRSIEARLPPEWY